MTWQVHVYGVPLIELVTWCDEYAASLHSFDWRTEYETAGLARDAFYLLRPDTYVALADKSGAPSALDRYFTDRNIRMSAR
jgi:hypothetical protein